MLKSEGKQNASGATEPDSKEVKRGKILFLNEGGNTRPVKMWLVRCNSQKSLILSAGHSAYPKCHVVGNLRVCPSVDVLFPPTAVKQTPSTRSTI